MQTHGGPPQKFKLMGAVKTNNILILFYIRLVRQLAEISYLTAPKTPVLTPEK